MRGVCVSSKGNSTKGSAELNHHVRNEQKEEREEAGGGGRGLSEEDESRINNAQNDNTFSISQRPVTKPQGSVVCWERFLPVGTLKVLLVEFDDSTRHVVSALLRNCSYEVTAVANGIEAWRILADITNHIDLVLTEVAMPYLSGIGLLNKITSHKTCKNIPVIMMSSNDSMGIVFKCLSKGAVDFLVKPIRKNELKNLWQHVWRKCHSSSGSGSESGIRTQKSSKSKSVEGIGNNNVSNDEDDIASISLNDRNGSDNGSGTQSSWTKRAVEVESSQPVSPWDELADAPDSTCAQVIQLRPEEFSINNWVPPKTASKELHGNNKLGDIAMGKDLEIGVPRNSDSQREDQSKEFQFSVSVAQERKNLESKTDNVGAKLEKDKIQLNGDTSNDKSREEVADLIGVMNCANPTVDGIAAGLPDNNKSKTNIKDEGMYNGKEIPSLVLSLKRQRDVGEVEDTPHEQNVLKRSNLSAFSRYNTISNANQTLTGNVGSCSPHDNSSEADKTENPQSNSKGTPNQRSNGSSNNNDMGSTTNNTFANLNSNEKVQKSAFQPVRNGHTASIQPVTPSKGDADTNNTVLTKASDISSQVQVQHHHHHYHHHHHHVHSQNLKKAAKTDALSLKTVVGSPTALTTTTTPVEGNAANYSLNGSASGSYNGSNNGQNGTEGANIGSENGLLATNCENGAAGRSGVDQSRYSHREAALNKFRQKRKERCFDKKVRYQSRKKLAEQRPRVRGQFVRQGVYDNKSKDNDC